MDLRARLQALLESDYAIERELGGGGMSRVFVATEKRLGRRVVIKVLSPELAATLSTGRFQREIQVAASLQQANIVPVLTAGEVEGTPYFTMPFVEGESLRGRLGRGPLSEHEALSILRDVARALVYAHEHGIVHRDIKPDNVLLSGEAAVVTDFGIAKAINAARTQAGANETGAMTQVGTAIGTPAYMAPEQAAGDPATDHRADIYAFGCLAIELLTGSPPFVGLAPHKLMAAHMSEPAPLLGARKPGSAPALEALVASCLAKMPEERPATARDVLHQLESVVSGATRDALPAALGGRQWSLARAVGIWAAVFGATWILARATVVGIGLPSWTVPLALIVAGLGLPAVLVTWYVHTTARRALLNTPTRTPGGTAVQSTMATMALRAVPHVSWTRTWRGFALAGGAVVVAIAIVMVLRLFGLGPAASLMAAGRIGADSRVLVAEFASNASDTTLGGTLAQAMRTSIAQSKAVQLVTPEEVAAGLKRMTLPAASSMTEKIAHELAVREGIPLIVVGQLSAVGSGFLVSVRLVSADSGKELASFQRGANGAADLLDAMDKLARDLRSRVGESLRSVQRAPALEQATTSSLVALREYTRALQQGDVEGDQAGAIEHLLTAVHEDSTFALAWRKLGVYSNNLGRPRSEGFHAVSQAYRFRDRLSGDERAEVEAYYLFNVGTRPAIAAYRAAPGLNQNNQANQLSVNGEFAAAESVATAEIARLKRSGRPPMVQLSTNLGATQLVQGRITEARRTLADMKRDFPGGFYTERSEAWVSWSAGGLDSAAAVNARLLRSKSLLTRDIGARAEATLTGGRGQLRRYAELSKSVDAIADSARTNRDRLTRTAQRIVALAVYRRDAPRGVKELDSLAAANPQARVPVLDRSDLEIAAAYAQLGQPAKAKPLVAEFERSATREERLIRWGAWQAAQGEVALAEGKANDALAAFRRSTAADSGKLESSSSSFPANRFARAYDLAGQRDSAIVNYERYLQLSQLFGFANAAPLLPNSLRRLGELYEAKGDATNAIGKYETFVKLWKDADAELQPQVAEIKGRIERLRAVEARKR
jgi:tetratricopeptide (TPR) repeat protein